MESMGVLALIHAFFPCARSKGLVYDSPQDVLNRFHPPRPDWYEELYAWFLDRWMGSYEAKRWFGNSPRAMRVGHSLKIRRVGYPPNGAERIVEVASYKAQLFDQLRGKAKDFLEIGIGAGPNLKFYAGDAGVSVIGTDPNKKMEKYARATAEAVGLPPSKFQFVQADGEALPLPNASVDVVIGTLVLCSVKDVSRTLREVKRVLRPGGYFLFLEHVAARDGTILKFVQKILNPLQQLVSDGCHLTRETGKYIAAAGFSEVDSNIVSISSASLINPQLYGIARK